MKLTSTSDKIQVVTTTTANIDVYATWGDYDPAVSPSTDRVTFGRLISKISSATTTDVVPVPGSGDTRKVHIVNISNIHASTANVITLQITDGTNTAVIDQFPLAAGERATWREGVPLRIIDANGLEKTNPLAIGQYTVNRLAADLANTTTTAAKVTGLGPCVRSGNMDLRVLPLLLDGHHDNRHQVRLQPHGHCRPVHVPPADRDRARDRSGRHRRPGRAYRNRRPVQRVGRQGEDDYGADDHGGRRHERR